MIHKRKAAIVTGGGQGIRKTIAKRLLKDGMRAIIAELDQEAGDETVIELKALRGCRIDPHRSNSFPSRTQEPKSTRNLSSNRKAFTAYNETRRKKLPILLTITR
jgi:NAD(P)-dependent dehydrogenase (short-subunit alcohol dehydrogenase family)